MMHAMIVKEETLSAFSFSFCEWKRVRQCSKKCYYWEKDQTESEQNS
ncbi:hypothetical protein BC937DRAFT_87549 [Endogone sp. FLAS-F59071]|nr:hypothetical protein BC937DRAFT_87549 [Endogone sp. FLAS-F59071]|eukprot:RUS12549.1 hypothetical protein BC937DRAFT_87549 [Endogone sp. FLAS-F59071]